jgi:hypothetical protein
MKWAYTGLLLLSCAGCGTWQSVHHPAPGDLNRLLPVARHKAAELFEQHEEDLHFYSMHSRYDYFPASMDATNALRWYTFTFFDPASIESGTDGPSGYKATGYSVSLSADGAYKKSCGGLTLGGR